MAHRKPTPETLAFGAEVARLRTLARLSRAQLAKMVPVSVSYIGLIETGCTRCRYDFAQRLDGTLDSGTLLADAWDDLLRGTGYPKFFTDFAKAENAAVLIRTYQAMVVYGLMQTEAYARILVITDSAVEGRMKRQATLTKEDAAVACVVMDESVLYRLVGDREVMREQLEHLIAMSMQPNITLQIAPLGYYRGVHGSFTLATQPNGADVVYLSHTNGGNTSHETGDILPIVKAFATLQARALSPEASRDMIRKVLDERYGTDMAQVKLQQ